MRASEFINEGKDTALKARVPKHHQQSTKGLHLFTDSNFDRHYTLNRVMMAVASADGIEKPVLDSESWHAKRNTAHPYTDVEHKMLKHAYDAVGVDYNDLNHNDLDSQELDDVNTVSPVKPFKGYK
jgi:hypothetical protein